MRNAKALTFLWSSLLSFSLSLSAAMWLVTAFDLGVDTGFLTAFCLIASLVCSLCYTLPLGAAPLGIGALSLGFMWRSGALEEGVEAILNRLSRQYNNAYSWGIIRWSHRTADEMEPAIITALCILAAITALATAWAVCRKKSSFFPVLSILYVAACFVVNDTVPSVGWIFLLLMSVFSLLMTGRVRRQSEPAANRLLWILTPLIALGLFLVFLTNPQSAYDKQEIARYTMDKLLGSDHMQYLMGGLDSNSIGASDQNVNLTTVGYRASQEHTVMQVSAPFTDTLYLRSSAMDTYDGKSWSQSGSSDLPWPTTFLEAVGEVSVKTRFAHAMLYLPYYSTYSNLSGIAAGVQNQKNLREYSFTCLRLPANMTPQSAASLSSAYYPVRLEDYLHITPEVKIWAEPLALEITEGAVSFSEKAERIASFVRNSARYDLKTARMPGKEKDFARWFLEKSDTGYCIHFATATAVLLQAAGIPARYVTGYLTEVKADQVTEVKAKQSHAWVEYWLPGFGWVLLESTPPAALPGIPEPTETQEIPDGETYPATQPEDTTTPATVVPTEETKPSAQLMPGRGEHTALLTAILWVAVAAGLVAAVFIQRSLRLRRWKKRLADTQPNERALLLWQDAEHLANLLKTQPPKRLLELAEKAKFSLHTLQAEELQQFGAFRKDAVEQLKKRNLFLQIYYRLILVKY